MASTRQFKKVGALHPARSLFDLSYNKKFTCDMGQLIPVLCDEVVPGDYWKIGNEIVIRFQPMVAPILHEINATVHYFFVPYRLLSSDWEDFITGGPDGTETPTLPTWDPGAGGQAEGTLWDYFGLPTGVRPAGNYPLAFPLYAYNFVYNEFYRDQNLITEYALTDTNIKIRAWEKDYFTGCMPWLQRGTAPALPISGTTNATWANPVTVDWPVHSSANQTAMYSDNSTDVPYNSDTRAILQNNTVNDTELEANSINLASATTFTVNDLRLAVQIQKFLERSARIGNRYTEFLQGHFGVTPRDERLQRPEYIGGSKSPVIVSEVLQTSSTDVTTPQGNMAGHAITADSTFCAKYHVKEYGLIIGILSIMPRTAYQQGINKQWLRETRYDFYLPELAHLSEQAVKRVELYATNVEVDNDTLFGYIPRYDEMRVKHDIVCGEMRSTYDYWHIGRQFAAAPELNQTFIQCVPRKDFLAAPAEPACIVNFANKIIAARPLPSISDPGYMDHF